MPVDESTMPHPADTAPRFEADAVAELRTTFSCRDRAAACARHLIERRLAACVQIDGPVTSIYRWQGVMETAEEFRCTCKTSVARAAACSAAILGVHEYATPELLVVVAQASPAYAAWVRAEVETHSDDGDQTDADAPA
jgi:periplasmic divalent cation tolerance protein